MEARIRRQTAKITSIDELIRGDYVIQEGWKPNYVQTKSRRLSRVNIIGIIIEKSSPFQLTIDDGSGSIEVTDFNNSKSTEKTQVGQGVLIIGRPRKSNEGLFIAAEIVQSSQIKENPLWLIKRKQELKEIEKITEIDDEYTQIKPNPIKEDLLVEKNTLVEDQLIEKINNQTTEINETKSETIELTDDKIIKFIRKKDDGQGCLIEDIIKQFGEEADNTILTLIAMGEIYEIKPGKIKVLE